jgi:UDP-N-acetylmuramyl pentapeptide phosphotransferase/UDP-N-acetylglucosamine-1-phosphate transferase
METEIFLTFTQLVLFIIAAALLSAAGTSFLVKFLTKYGVIDKPNKRSNHKNPIPRGGGIAVIGTFLLLFLTISIIANNLEFLWPILAGGALLMLVSWVDDINSLSPIIRIVSQFMAVGLTMLYPHPPLFNGLLPEWLDTISIIILWVWFINLYNFMDGIDGITCTETITICLTIALLPLFTNFSPEVAILASILAVCCITFLPWNWHKAKIFLGDVGSVPLGYFVGWMLLVIIMSGYWYIAIILPAYYLADSGITLLKRIIARKKIWKAHSEHYYQQAVRSGKSHSNVVLKILTLNIILATLSLLAVTIPAYSLYCVFVAIVLTLILLYRFKQNAK